MPALRVCRHEQAHFADWRDKIKVSADDGIDHFLSCFDTTSGVDEALVQGAWDFSHHILKPKLPHMIGEPFQSTALEIGFGGGRLLLPASRHFARVVGVDIHDNFDEVRRLLDKYAATNVELIKGDGKTLPVPDGSIDFVYSFIVLQHLPLLETLECYLAEVKRVLKPGLAACLYFGHLPFNWRFKKYQDLTIRQVESFRENTLLLRPSFTRRLLTKSGLRVMEMGRSQKKPWRENLGQQHYAIVTA